MQLELINDEIPEGIKIWVAAAIEYEGNISLIKSNRDKNYSAQVRITNTNRGLVDCAELRLFGGRLDLQNEPHPRWKPRWRRNYHGKDAERLLKAIKPHLKTKIEQAEIILRFLERKGASSTRYLLYDDMYKRMKELNKRGK